MHLLDFKHDLSLHLKCLNAVRRIGGRKYVVILQFRTSPALQLVVRQCESAHATLHFHLHFQQLSVVKSIIF